MMRKILMMMAVILLANFVMPATAMGWFEELKEEAKMKKAKKATAEKKKKEAQKKHPAFHDYYREFMAGHYFHAARIAKQANFLEEDGGAELVGWQHIILHMKAGRIEKALTLYRGSIANKFGCDTANTPWSKDYCADPIIKYVSDVHAQNRESAKLELEETIDDVKDPVKRCILERELGRECVVRYNNKGKAIEALVTYKP